MALMVVSGAITSIVVVMIVYSSNTDGGDHGVDGSEWCDDVDCYSDDGNYGNG